MQFNPILLMFKSGIMKHATVLSDVLEANLKVRTVDNTCKLWAKGVDKNTGKIVEDDNCKTTMRLRLEIFF